jgi:hypothetical protein
VVYDRGEVPMPARLTITLASGDTLYRDIPVTTWLSGTRTASVMVPGGQAVTRVEIDAQHEFPDMMRKNNLWAEEAEALAASLVPAIRNDLVRKRTELLGQGYQPEGELLSSSIARRKSEYRTLTLEGGARYAILGVCDEECYDIDLVLSDAADSTLVQDVQPDDTPVIAFTAPATGQYRLETVMFSCRLDNCAWTGQIFRHEAPAVTSEARPNP